MSEEPLSIVTDWPSMKTDLLDFLRKQPPDLGPFVCRDAAAIIEHLDSSLGAAEARVAALEAERERLIQEIEREVERRQRLHRRAQQAESELTKARKQIAKFHEDAVYTAKLVGEAADGAIDAWQGRAEKAEAENVRLTQVAEAARDDLRGAWADIIAIKGHLIKPYPDDPRWTPWTRFAERALRTIENTRDSLAKAAE